MTCCLHHMLCALSVHKSAESKIAVSRAIKLELQQLRITDCYRQSAHTLSRCVGPCLMRTYLAQREEPVAEGAGEDSPRPGDLPPNGVFPQTLAELQAFSAAQTTALTNFYGAHIVQEDLEMRRRQLEDFIQGL